MVDWSLARQLAHFAAGNPGPAPDLGFDFAGAARQAADSVGSYTGLSAGADPPVPELVDRTTWVDANLETLGSMLDPVGDRLAARMDYAGPLAGPLRVAASATLAAEVGLVMGYMSQRVLGQYEVSLLQPDSDPRLLFVAPNLQRAGGELDVDRPSFLGWVVLHEVTHVLQFAGVPWLRERLGALMREYLETVEVRIERGSAGGLPTMPNPAKIVEAFREGGLAALVQNHEQREIMGRVQALMAVVEGHAEHVMDAVGAEVLPSYAGLREAMDRRRATRSAPERALQRLLGFDLKLRQYEVGKRFCDAVVGQAGMDGLGRVWSSPEAVPTLSELDHPRVWLARVQRALPAAAA